MQRVNLVRRAVSTAAVRASARACQKTAPSRATVPSDPTSQGADAARSPGARARAMMEAAYRTLAAIALPNMDSASPSADPRAAFLASWEMRDPM